MKYQTIANKYTGAACAIYTLDGIKAGTISGRLDAFATVRALDGSVGMQVNWPTVECKMESDKLFYAC